MWKGITMHIFILESVVVFHGYEACNYRASRFVEQNELQALWVACDLPARGVLLVEFGF